MITDADFWAGRDVTHARELSTEIRENAAALLPKVNALLGDFEAATGVAAESCNSGWRPKSVNDRTPNASKTSKHLTGNAADIGDAAGLLDAWLLTDAGQASLERNGLWHEHPRDTPGWAHLQDEPFGSWRAGRFRTFYAR